MLVKVGEGVGSKSFVLKYKKRKDENEVGWSEEQMERWEGSKTVLVRRTGGKEGVKSPQFEIFRKMFAWFLKREREKEKGGEIKKKKFCYGDAGKRGRKALPLMGGIGREVKWR